MSSLRKNVPGFILGILIGGTMCSTTRLMYSCNCNDHQHQQSHSLPPIDPIPCSPQPLRSSMPLSSTPAFDQMNNKLYKIATQPAPIPRKQYSIGAVKDTGGGLEDSERTLLASLYSNSSSVFEFGLGESTHIAGYIGVPRLAGVDSDAVWVNEARNGANDTVATSRMNHFRFSFADIGELGIYGRALNESLQKIPYNYQSGPLNNELQAFDFYFVDGRYRVACACASFLHAMSRGGNMKNVLVGFHDWMRGNTKTWNWGYWVMKEIADVAHLSTSEKLAILRLKEGVTEEKIVKIWEGHMWIRY